MSNSRTPAVLFLPLWVLLMSGCVKSLPTGEFVARYEKECGIQLDRDEYRFLFLYETSDYLAARLGGDSMRMAELASLRKEYGNGHYVRITIRPIPDPRIGTEDELLAKQFLLGQKLTAIQGDLSGLVKLQDGNGDKVDPIAVTVQKGVATGSPNTILVIFPLEFHGRKVDLEKCEIVLEEIGLNLGTLRTPLALPKGFQLKVAA